MFRNNKNFSANLLRKKEGEDSDIAIKRLQDQGWDIDDKNSELKENTFSYRSPDVNYKSTARRSDSIGLPENTKHEDKKDDKFSIPKILNKPDDVIVKNTKAEETVEKEEKVEKEVEVEAE